MSRRRRPELHNNGRRQVIEDYVPGQRPAYLPPLGMTRGHAAVFLLFQARRAVAGVTALRIIAVDDIPVVVIEMVICASAIAAVVARMLFFVALSISSVVARTPVITAPISVVPLLLLVFPALTLAGP
jgi:hypothetical protein